MVAAQTPLIIPVESQVRELDAKLLLGCAAAERGFRVILGSRALVHHEASRLPRGVYLAKSMRSLSDRMFGILRQLGHEIVAWDEEALVRFPRDHYYQRRLSPRALEKVSHLLTWGEDDADLFRQFPQYAGTPIHVTGNPRIDLLRPELRSYFEPEIRTIRERHGKLVMVNTNFGYVNAFASSLNLLQGSGSGDRTALSKNSRGMNTDFALGLAAHKQALFEQFRLAVPAMAHALPEHTLVIRPHPSEDHAAWHRAADGLDNVTVTGEASAVPWLMAADAVVHNGCTTAIEAAVLGLPAIAYQPVTHKDFDFELPNALSHQVFGVDALAGALREVAAKKLGSAVGANERALLERHIAYLEGPLASDCMVDAISGAGYGDQLPAAPSLAARIAGHVRLQLRAREKRRNSRQAGHRNTRAFHDHRFPGTSTSDLDARIQRFTESLDRFDNLRTRDLSHHLFEIVAS